MPFFQTPPSLGNQYTADRVLRSLLARALPPDVHQAIEPELYDLGELAGGPLYRALQAGYRDEPRLTSWGPWGERVDDVELTPLWRDCARLAAERGLIGAGYNSPYGVYGRLHQLALAYLFEPSSGVYSCPLAMTDGAAKTLLVAGNRALIDRAVPRLTSRDPAVAWTSGQWMTERTGGSDVGLSETTAVADSDGRFRLYGTKWFTSAVTSQMALTLARPEGNAAGGGGLALFYVEMRDETTGALNGITVNRLKEKLGTKMVPTAELTLAGTLAHPVAGLRDGTKRVAPMLAITRLWNSMAAVAGMRRAIALARDYADRRVAFGAPLAQKPLHLDTLAGIEAEYEGAFHLVFRVVELLGREEAGTLDEHETGLLRLATPLAKLTTGKQAVAIASEVLESFGGAGYIEDTGLPRLLRDAQVLPIWEGTTNVLSLDVLRALAHGASVATLRREIDMSIAGAKTGALAGVAESASTAIAHASSWFTSALASGGPPAVEAGARRFALTLGRSLELALLVKQATWEAQNGRDPQLTVAAARRFARNGVDLICNDDSREDAALLATYR